MGSIADFIKGTFAADDANSIEIIGTNRIIIENAYSIIKYSDYDVTISMGKRIIDVFGCELQLKNYCENIVVITGKINTINFI